MLWRVHRRTVNPSPCGKHSWFDSKLLHQIWSQSVHGRTSACHAERRGSLPLGTAKFIP